MTDMAPRRGRVRIAAAARKLAAAADAREVTEADTIGAGVRAVAMQIVSEIEPGALYWRAPLQYVCEQMAPRVAKEHGIPESQVDDLAAYLLAGINEYVVTLAGEFDTDHFVAWAGAEAAREPQP